MFLGSGEKYLNFFEKYPGTYFKTTGWIERSENPEELSQLSISRQSGMESTYDELVEKYGEDNAKFLYETLVQNTHHYSKLAFISMGVEPDDRFEKIVREDAVGRKWKFEKITGDMRLIQHLMDGEWNEDEFLVVPEGRSIVATHDDSIVGDRGE
jgi:hypothetical protein